MSTRRIRELLKWARAQDADTHAFDGTSIGPPPLDEVQREVEAIEKAARTIHMDNAGEDWATADDRTDAGRLMELIATESST